MEGHGVDVEYESSVKNGDQLGIPGEELKGDGGCSLHTEYFDQINYPAQHYGVNSIPQPGETRERTGNQSH